MNPIVQKLPQPITRTLSLILAGSLVACGGVETDPEQPSIEPGELSLIASPAGGDFMYEVQIALFADAAVEIYYTLDGESPMGEHSQLYDEPLLVNDSTLLRFAAKTPDGRWTASFEELYTPLPDYTNIKEASRMLRLSAGSLYFAAHTGDDVLTRSVTVHSVGLEHVQIKNVYVGIDPDASSFFTPGIFLLETELSEAVSLASGETIEFDVSYMPTETLSSAALILETDDERVEEGFHVVHLSGRIFDW